MHIQCDIANYVKMSKKTCILLIRYLNGHAVAILCTISYMSKYIYKTKKELCKSEQCKYLNSKLVLTLCKFDVNSLHSVRILQCFPCCMHDFLQISNIMHSFSLFTQELMFCNVWEYLNHCNICFSSIECQKQTKRSQNGAFLTMCSFFNPCMQPECLQTLYSQYLFCNTYHREVSYGLVHSLIYDKSLYAEF